MIAQSWSIGMMDVRVLGNPAFVLGASSALSTPITVGAHKDHFAVHLLNFWVPEVEDSRRGLPRGEK